MKKFLLSSLLGLSIIAGSFAIAPAANANQWRNYSTGWCLSIAADNTNPGAGLVIWPCHDASASLIDVLSQEWNWDDRVGPYFFSTYDAYINNSLVLAIAGGKIANGTHVVTGVQSGNLAQMWDWEDHYVLNDRNGNACYAIINDVGIGNANGTVTHFALGVLGGSKSLGAPVVIWSWFLNSAGQPDYVNHPDQLWCAY